MMSMEHLYLLIPYLSHGTTSKQRHFFSYNLHKLYYCSRFYQLPLPLLRRGSSITIGVRQYLDVLNTTGLLAV